MGFCCGRLYFDVVGRYGWWVFFLLACGGTGGGRGGGGEHGDITIVTEIFGFDQGCVQKKQ